MEEKSTCFSLPSLLSDENMYFCCCVNQRIADVQSLCPEDTLFLKTQHQFLPYLATAALTLVGGS